MALKPERGTNDYRAFLNDDVSILSLPQKGHTYLERRRADPKSPSFTFPFWVRKIFCIEKEELRLHLPSFKYKAEIYVEPRKMVQMNRFAGQKQRHRCREQMYGHERGEVAGWG